MVVVASLFLIGAVAYYAVRAAYRLFSYTHAHNAKSPASSHAPSSYPHRFPFWGLDLSLEMWRDFSRGELAEGMRRRHAHCGTTFQARELFGGKCIYTIDPENIRAVTTSQFTDFQKSAWVDEASKHIGHGVLMNEGEAWRRSKAVLKPVFSRTRLDELALVAPHVEKMLSVIQQQNGETFDFLELATRFSLDVVTDFLFDGSVDSLATADPNTEGRQFLSLVKSFEPACGLFIAVGALAWFKLAVSYKQLLAVVGGMKTFFKQRIDLLREKQKYQPGGQKSCTSLFRMLEQQGLSVDDMQGELQNIFFASFDTTSALLANLVHVLAQRPDIQDKIRDEIKYLEGKPPTKQDISGMTYLRCVIYEGMFARVQVRRARPTYTQYIGLRLYTPVASHSRQAAVDTTLPKGGGPDGQAPLHVDAGTSVVWSIYALNRSPAYYGDDWAEFRPERWEGLRPAAACPNFMPFGSGPRSCIGQEMAQREIAYVLLRLLQAFGEMESRDKRPFREAEAVSFYSAHGTMVAMS